MTKNKQRLCAAYAYIMLTDKRNENKYGMQSGYGQFDGDPDHSVHYGEVIDWLVEVHENITREAEGEKDG